MTLDTRVLALQRVMKGEEVSEEYISDRAVRDTLVAYETERQARPKLVEALSFPSLIKDYLDLPLDSRQRLDEFNERYPEYLRGEGDGYGKTKIIYTFQGRSIANLSRSANQLIKAFEVYLSDNKDGEVFNVPYIRMNKITFGGRSFSDSLKIAVERRPDILDYISLKETNLFRLFFESKTGRSLDEFVREKYKEVGSSTIGDDLSHLIGKKISPRRIIRILNMSGIRIRSVHEAGLFRVGLDSPISKEVLYDLYVNKNFSTTDIADRFGVARVTICDWLRKNNIKVRSRGESNESKIRPSNNDLMERYNELCSYKKVAKRIGVSSSSVYKWLKEAREEAERGKE